MCSTKNTCQTNYFMGTKIKPYNEDHKTNCVLIFISCA